MSQLPIHHTFGPLADRRQCLQAFLLLLQPWRWIRGRDRELLRRTLSQSFQQDTYLFSSGRKSLLAALKALHVGPGEEVILQGFTCAVVPNAIMAVGAKPVYVDIDPHTLNIDHRKVQQAVTNKTRAIICQHTFGIPADTEALRKICDKRDLALIEDCAHIMPTDDSTIGTVGDLTIFSFGRDKAVSGVSGGAVLSKHAMLSNQLQALEQEAGEVSRGYVFRRLCYPLFYGFARSTWNIKLGKPFLYLLRLLTLLPAVLTAEEKKGAADTHLTLLPNACASLVREQGFHMQQLNEHRKQIADLYKQAADAKHWDYAEGIATTSAPQKFPLFSTDAQKIREDLKKKQIYLDDGWCRAVVNPDSVDQAAMQYTKGMCPIAEQVARVLVSLPTHPTMNEQQAKKLVEELNI